MASSKSLDKGIELPRLDATSGWRSWLSIPTDCFNAPWVTFLLIVVAWFICAMLRYQWLAWADGFEQFKFMGYVQPTTHDAFTHGATLQQHIEGFHEHNPHIYPIMNGQGAIHALSWVFLKIFPITIPQLLIWAPIILGSMMVVPIILIGRLYGSSLYGFTASLLAGMAWNYYERSMAGYFDTDMFSFWIAMLVMCFLLGAHEKKSLVYAMLGALVVFFYPFFYAKGLVIGAGIAWCFIGLQIVYIIFRKDVFERFCTVALVGAGTAASPWSNGWIINRSPWLLIIGFLLILTLWYLLTKWKRNYSVYLTTENEEGRKKVRRQVSVVALICLFWLLFSMPWSFFFVQIATYSHLFTSNPESIVQMDPVELKRAEIIDQINFRNTHKHTVLESRGEPFDSLCRRIMGSVTGAILAFIGYILICIRYPGFLIGAPMAAIGLFAFDGGLRFTTWGSGVGAVSLVYLLFVIPQILLRCLPRVTIRARKTGAVVAGMLISAPFISINMVHAISFKVPPVFQRDAIAAMTAIKEASNPGDYVVSWWDYGSGLWYYSGNNVLTTPISVTDDCWTVSKLVMSDSQQVAAGLAQASVGHASNGYLPASHQMLGLDTDSPIYPDDYLAMLKSGEIDIPEITKNVFLYFSMDMLRLLNVLEAYSDSSYDLPKGPEAGVFHFLPPGTVQSLPSGHEVMLPNGIILNLRNLTTYVIDKASNTKVPIQFKEVYYVAEDMDRGLTNVRTGPKLNGQPLRVTVSGGVTSQYRILRPDEEIPPGCYPVSIVVLEESGVIIIMDDEFLNSNIIQMVVLQQFDPNLWKLIHKSGFARVFQLVDQATAQKDSVTIDEVELEGPPAP